MGMMMHYNSNKSREVRCSECRGAVTEGHFKNKELNKVYCGVGCMLNDMNRTYGIGQWTFVDKDNLDLSKVTEPEQGDNRKVSGGSNIFDEYEYLLFTDKVSVSKFEMMLENTDNELWKDLDFKETNSSDEEDTDSDQQEAVVELVKRMWVPYHMYYVPAVQE